MKRILEILSVTFFVSLFVFSCTKKPLTLDDETSMKTLMKASDSEITELVVKEASEKANLPKENIDVKYILRDEKSQAIAVKLKIKTE